MAYLNTKNMCFFQGRVAKVNVATKNGSNGPYKNVRFSIAVDRQLTKDERARAKTDSSIRTTDFVWLSCNGQLADMIEKYFPVGKSINVCAQYTTYEKINSQTGQKEYGSSFNVVSVDFVTQDKKDLANNSGGSTGGYQHQQQSSKPVGIDDMFDTETYDAGMNPLDDDQAF